MNRYLFGVSLEGLHYYQDQSSLFAYIANTASQNSMPFPNYKGWAIDGIHKRKGNQKVTVRGGIGFYGYFLGVEKINIDPHGLSDPLLSRLPVTSRWRIGHFTRSIPDGYIDTLKTGINHLADPKLAAFYEKLKIITQNRDLFSLERLKTIIAMNFGRYNHFIQHIKLDVRKNHVECLNWGDFGKGSFSILYCSPILILYLFLFLYIALYVKSYVFRETT